MSCFRTEIGRYEGSWVQNTLRIDEHIKINKFFKLKICRRATANCQLHAHSLINYIFYAFND